MSDEWVKAGNLIRQQTQIMINELSSLTERVSNQARSIDILQRERDAAVNRYDNRPDGLLLSENSSLKRQLREAEAKISEYREYMRLKDNAKIKVEGQREYWREKSHENERLYRIRTDRERAHLARIQELETLNARQAQEFANLESKIANKDALIRTTSAENGRLLEVIRLGRAGLEGETW